MEVLEKIHPLYTVYWYTDFLYRVVKFKRSSCGFCFRSDDDDRECPLDKFAQSYCRARSMVLQYALCNKWDYFITITVSPERFDRWNLDAIYKYLSQWIRDYRKKYERNVKYVIVPEKHKDGAWHFHGFISGVAPDHIMPFVKGMHPQKLVDAGYFNFPLLAQSVGFVSCAPIRDPVAASFYISKYVTKEHARDGFYEHLYYCSRGLNHARPVADAYAYEPILESSLEFDNDFCSCGWVRGQDFTFPDSFELRDIQSLVPVRQSELEDASETNLVFVQLSLADWLEFS